MDTTVKYLDPVGVPFSSERYRKIFGLELISTKSPSGTEHQNKRLLVEKVLASIPETLKLYAWLLEAYDPSWKVGSTNSSTSVVTDSQGYHPRRRTVSAGGTHESWSFGNREILRTLLCQI